jgi:hypothetical protein
VRHCDPEPVDGEAGRLDAGRGSMMRVKLVDVDNKYREKSKRGLRWQNRALMGISTLYKSRGCEVGFDTSKPDLVFVSCVFKKNIHNALRECTNEMRADNVVSIGGSGISLKSKLSEEIELIKPDYDLYPVEGYHQHSLGFTTRGCIRNCEFCIVNEKEGAFRRVQHVKEFVDFRYKNVTLLDNNILADKEWFFENTNWILDHKLRLNISQGMDIRLLTDEIAEQLHRIKFVDQQMRFAWDRVEMEETVKTGIEMLKDHGINVRRNVSFFVLSGYTNPKTGIPVPFCKDVYRCNRLKEMGAMPYVMPWEGGTPIVRALARWANRRALRDKPFWQYDRLKKAGVSA